MAHWKSTDVKHFVQWLTPNKADGDGPGGYIENPGGSGEMLYNLKQENPPVEYHIETDEDSVSDWLVMEDRSITDFRKKPITSDAAIYIIEAVGMGMLEIVE